MKINQIIFGASLLLVSAPAWAQWTDPGNDGAGDIYYNGGNVGVGVAAPTQKLHVDGNILSGGQTLFLGPSQLYANQDKLYFYSNNNDRSIMVFHDGDNTRHGYIYGGNNGGSFGLMDADGEWSYLASKGNYTAFSVAGDEKMRIQHDGKVGIGTANRSVCWK